MRAPSAPIVGAVTVVADTCWSEAIDYWGRWTSMGRSCSRGRSRSLSRSRSRSRSRDRSCAKCIQLENTRERLRSERDEAVRVRRKVDAELKKAVRARRKAEAKFDDVCLALQQHAQSSPPPIRQSYLEQRVVEQVNQLRPQWQFRVSEHRFEAYSSSISDQLNLHSPRKASRLFFGHVVDRNRRVMR